MADLSPLLPATADEIAETLAFALRYEGRRRFTTLTRRWAGLQSRTNRNLASDIVRQARLETSAPA